MTVLVDYDGGQDLVPVTVWNGHEMSILDIARYLNDKVKNAK